MSKQLLLVVVMLNCVIPGFAFSGAGSGTASDPYRIFNAGQLNEIRNATSACYQLEADIDLTSWIEENNPAQGWNPISDFSGTLNGNNHSISNLRINRKNTDNVGLFSSLKGCNISNLYIINAEIIGNNNVGCLSGTTTKGYYNGRGYIDNIRIIDCVIHSVNNAGILVGATNGTTITNCYVYGEVVGNNYIGGIVGYGGYNDIEILKCNSNVSIKGNDYLGGICGIAENALSNQKIQTCSAYGNIIGNGYTGGILGSGIPETFSQCLSACNYIKGEKVGGIFSNEWAVSISSCFSINNLLEGSSNVYRIGPCRSDSKNNYAWVLTKMIVDGEELGQPDDSDYNGISIGLTALKQKSTYSGVGWDFDNDWDINETESFPFFKNQTPTPTINTPLFSGQTVISGQSADDAKIEVRVNGVLYQTVADGNNWSVDVAELHSCDKVVVITYKDQLMPSVMVDCTVCPVGEGSESDPYKVYEANDLLYCSNSGYFELMNNIDLTDWIEANSNTNGWIGIDGRNLISLNGNGHTITGLWADLSDSNMGLFSELGKNSIIKSLNVVVADKGLKGSGNSGVIAGINNGTIARCSVSGGAINNNSMGNAGGIAGTSYGIIEDCTTKNDIDAGYAAGIVGKNYGVIQNTLATGKISGETCAGIVGTNVTSEAQVQNCVALNSLISGTKSALRIVAGISDGAPVPSMNNFASELIKLTLNGMPQDVSEDPVNGKTLTAEECKDKSTYESMGWDFNEIWGIADGYSFPYLKHNKISVTSLTLNVMDWEGKIGETNQLVATVSPGDATNNTLTWSVDNPEIASVDDNGLVKALAVGATQVHVKTTDGSNLEVSCNITVKTNVVLVTSLSLDPEVFSGEIGDTFTIKPVILPENATDKTVSWNSSNENIAFVDNRGNVSILSEGVCVITAVTVDGSDLSAECIITSTCGIDEMLSEGTECIEVYNIQGILLLKDVDMNALKKLPSGIYILRQGRKYNKIRID